MRSSLTKFISGLIFASLPVLASQLSSVSDSVLLGTNDSVSWGQLGQPFQTFNSGITASSSGGIQVTGTSQSLERVNEGSGWIGIFPTGDQLLWNKDTGDPLTFVFSTPVNGVGALVQGDAIGMFSATLTAFDGTTNLGSFSVTGNNIPSEAGSAPFLGVVSDSRDITSVVFSESSASGFNHLAVDGLELSTVVPEPRSAGLVLLALLAVVGMAGFNSKRV